MKYDREGPFIVGFGHRRRVGKDTLADLVRKHLAMNSDLRAERVSFARRLKQTAYKLFLYAGLQDPDFYDVHPERREVPLPEIGKSPRDLWIEMGNRLRDVDPDIWIRNALDDPPRPEADVVLVSDVRYPNEAAYIRKRLGLLVKVVRPGVSDSDDIADSALAGLPDGKWDKVVVNDGGLDALDREAGYLAGLIPAKAKARKRQANGE